MRNLSDEEFSAINKALIEEMQSDIKLRGGTLQDSYIFRIIDYITKHGKAKRDELAAFLETDEKTITRKVNILKGLGLLRSDKDGYSFTPKGIKFIKRWVGVVPDVPHVPGLGDRHPVRVTSKRLSPLKVGTWRTCITMLYQTRPYDGRNSGASL
ncbi:MAG: hypothetical protein QXH03_10185 [Candidatus Bathyarchaeia archaeon]